MDLKDLKPGDRVIRFIAQKPFMEMEVLYVDEKLISCAAIEEGRLFDGGWTFDRQTGVEEDDELKWGVEYGQTGSYIKPKERLDG